MTARPPKMVNAVLFFILIYVRNVFSGLELIQACLFLVQARHILFQFSIELIQHTTNDPITLINIVSFDKGKTGESRRRKAMGLKLISSYDCQATENELSDSH